MAFNEHSLDDYVDVAERIATFREKYPEGSLQPADLAHPYRVEVINGVSFVSYVAAAFRTPDDVRPGVGSAWEPVPGTTPYTRNSELQNAETAAWGRAIQAALAADAKRGVASRQEVRNRQAERSVAEAPATAGLVARINAIPNGARAKAMKAVREAFGPPDAIDADRMAEAEALVASFEAVAPTAAAPELALAGKVNGNGKAA